MIKKIIIAMLVLSTYLVAAINVQTASKAELMSISGIGEKKANAIMKYRKTNRLKSADDLVKVDGIGKGIVRNVKGNVQNKGKGSKAKAKKAKKKSAKSSKKVTKKKKNTKKKKAKK